MARSFELGALGYVVKCADYGAFREKLETIEVYVAPTRSPEMLEIVRR